MSEEDFGIFYEYKNKATDKRNDLYTTILSNFADNQRKMHKTRRNFKRIFFGIICLSLVGVLGASCAVMIIVAAKPNLKLTDFGAALTGLGGIISSIIVLPKIVAEHLFPKDGDNSEADIVKQMQNFDLVLGDTEIGFNEEEMSFIPNETEPD